MTQNAHYLSLSLSLIHAHIFNRYPRAYRNTCTQAGTHTLSIQTRNHARTPPSILQNVFITKHINGEIDETEVIFVENNDSFEWKVEKTNIWLKFEVMISEKMDERMDSSLFEFEPMLFNASSLNDSRHPYMITTTTTSSRQDIIDYDEMSPFATFEMSNVDSEMSPPSIETW